jgi:hypothetical protein
MFTVLVELVVRAERVLRLPCSPLTVSYHSEFPRVITVANSSPDAKQARDLVTILTEAKQQVDPRLAEMARFGGGGGGSGGGRWGGRGRGYGGRGRGGSFTASNAAPLGSNRRW